MPANWRLLEAEIIYAMRKRGYRLDEYCHSGDKIAMIGNHKMNLTTLAQELSERVEVKGGKS